MHAVLRGLHFPRRGAESGGPVRGHVSCLFPSGEGRRWRAARFRITRAGHRKGVEENMRSKLAGLTLILAAIVSIAGCTIAVQSPPATSPLPPPPPPAPSPTYGYDIGLFYDDLDPYGSWFELSPYGYVW